MADGSLQQEAADSRPQLTHAEILSLRELPAPPFLSPTAGRAVVIDGRKYIENANGWLDEVYQGRTFGQALEAAYSRETRNDYFDRMSRKPAPISDRIMRMVDEGDRK